MGWTRRRAKVGRRGRAGRGVRASSSTSATAGVIAARCCARRSIAREEYRPGRCPSGPGDLGLGLDPRSVRARVRRRPGARGVTDHDQRSIRWQMTAQPSSMKARCSSASALVAGPQPAEVVQPGEAALDHPALAAQARAVLAAAAGDHRLDAALPAARGGTCRGHSRGRRAAARRAGAAGRPCRAPARPVDQRQQLGDVVAVAAGQADRQRDPAGVGQQVVLGARAGTVNRRGPGQGPLEERGCGCRRPPPSTSRSARPRSAGAAARGAARANTPAACHSCSRRCAVAGEQPSSRGRCRHAIPVNKHEHDRPESTPGHRRAGARRADPARCTGTSGSIDLPQLVADLPHRRRHATSSTRGYVYPDQDSPPQPSKPSPAEVLRQLLSPATP